MKLLSEFFLSLTILFYSVTSICFFLKYLCFLLIFFFLGGREILIFSFASLGIVAFSCLSIFIIADLVFV